MTTETLELACLIKCEGGLEIDNADLVIAYAEHFNGEVTICAKTIQMRVSDENLIRAVKDALKQRAKDAKDEDALLNAGIF